MRLLLGEEIFLDAQLENFNIIVKIFTRKFMNLQCLQRFLCDRNLYDKQKAHYCEGKKISCKFSFEGKQKRKLFSINVFYDQHILNLNLRPLTSRRRKSLSSEKQILCSCADDVWWVHSTSFFHRCMSLTFNWNKCLIQLHSTQDTIWLLLTSIQWIYIHLNRES